MGDRIVLAADSKQAGRTPSGKPPDPVKKFVVFSSTSVVAVVGRKEIRYPFSGPVTFRFDAIELLNGVKDSLPANASITSIEAVIENKLKAAMDRLAPYVANGTIKPDDSSPMGSDGIGFYIVGFEQDVPRVVVVGAKMDWNLRKISDPIIKSVNPPPNRPFATCAGLCKRYNFPGISDPVSTAVFMVRDEFEAYPEFVGPPINVVVLTRGQQQVETTLPK